MNFSVNGRALDVQRHFDRQAAGWQKKLEPDGSMGGRPRQFVRFLREYAPAQGNILDFGCGTGDITVACKMAGFDARGIDGSREMINCARYRFNSLKLQFDLFPDVNRVVLPYEDATFDAVVASSVLEYVIAPDAVLRELRRVCRGGGALIMSVPDMRNPVRWMEEIARTALALVGGRRFQRLSLYCDYLQISRNRFSMGKWRMSLAAAGWTPRVIRRERRPLMIMVASA